MARGHDLLFDPPLLRKEVFSSLAFEETITHPKNAHVFFLHDGMLWMADEKKVYRKNMSLEGGQAMGIIAKGVQNISRLGSIAFGDEDPVFYSIKTLSGDRTFPLGSEGALYPFEHIFITQDSVGSPLEATQLYAIDRDGNLYWQGLGSADNRWKHVVYEDSENKIFSYTPGSDGTIFFRANSMTFARDNNVFQEVRNTIGANSCPLVGSSKFVKYENDLLFLCPDGYLRNQAEQFIVTAKVKDMAANKNRLAILLENNNLVVFQDGKPAFRETLKKSYRHVLLEDERLLLVGQGEVDAFRME